MPLPPFKTLKQNLKDKTLSFPICESIWINKTLLNGFFENREVKKIKFFSDDCTSIHPDIKNVTNKIGGIYFFVVHPDILPFMSSYILYIGRAQNTSGQSLRARCSVYYNSYYKDESKRPHINEMLTLWSNSLYLYYIELSSNKNIVEIESKLIDNLLPPFNHKVDNPILKKVKVATRAWGI